MLQGDVLSSVGAVVHQEQLHVLGVVDEEGLVAGGHHVTGLLVATITDLSNIASYQHSLLYFPFHVVFKACEPRKGLTYGRHGNGALEASADAVVDTLGLAP